MKAKQENIDFYEELLKYLEIIRSTHKNRFEYVGKAKASSSPLCFCQWGNLNGFLNPNDEIKEVIKSFTISFGVTALHELNLLHTNKNLKEDNKFALDVMKFINNYVDRIKEEDDILYAVYGTPAESLCGTQVLQFREKYDIIKGVSDKDYFTNSFHLHVSEDVSPYEKQDKEEELFNLFKGGSIQYGRFGNPSNLDALKSFIERGLDKGFYVGVNFGKCTCEDCGNEFVNNDNEDSIECPNCKSKHITEVNRISGYLGYRTIKGDTTVNSAKLSEVKDRKSM